MTGLGTASLRTADMLRLAVAVLALIGLAIAPRPAGAEPVQARKAYDFVDSLGVVAHVSRRQGVLDDAGWAKISDAIAEIGLRYVRTTVTNAVGIARVRAMHAKHGTRFNLRIDSRALDAGSDQPLRPAAIDTLVALAKEVGPEAILSFEGPNEYNAQGQKHGNNAWPDELRTFARLMFERIKADPEIADKPVIAPSIWRRRVQDFQAVGDIGAFVDRACLHNYNASRPPSHELDERIANARILAPGAPVWVTEYGYNSAVGRRGVHFPITEYSQAKYLPRYAAEFFLRPEVERVFNFQIIDEWPSAEMPDKAWGLLRNDFSRRPSFHAMKNAIALLDDGDGDFTPGRLDYRLSGDMRDVRSFLVQKKNGVFYLVLWQEVESYDRFAQKDLHPSPRPVTVTFAAPPAGVRTYLPTGLDRSDPETARSPVASFAAPTSIELLVPDHLLIVEITPP